MKIIGHISLLTVTIASLAYNCPAKQTSAHPARVAAYAAVADNTAAVLKAYIGLKDELIKSDIAGIKTAALLLETRLAGIKGVSNTALLAHRIAAAPDVKAQRAAFLLLSQDMIVLVKASKVKTDPVYVDYCPMAGNARGGYWLSLDKTIQNPYFPEHMKECGQVREQIN